MAKGHHHERTHTSAPAPNSFENGDVGVKTAYNGPNSDYREKHRETLCLSDCNMKIEGCEHSAADCMKRYILTLCCCGQNLAHLRELHGLRDHNGHDGKKGHRPHHVHHEHHVRPGEE